MANLEIIPIPIGSQFVRSIGSNDPDSLNDFPVLLVFDENVTLTESGVSVNIGSSIVSIEGEHSVYKAIVRPQIASGIVTITVSANAVAEGNPVTSKSIRVSTAFPDDDAEVPTELFPLPASGSTVYKGIAVTPTRIITCRALNYGIHTFHFHTHDGTEQTSEKFTHSDRVESIDYFNGTLLFSRTTTGEQSERRSLTNDLIETYVRGGYMVSTDLGILFTNNFAVLPYGKNSADDLETLNRDFTGGGSKPAYQQSLIFMTHSSMPTLARIADNTVTILKRLNIDDFSDTFVDIAIYQDTLYVVKSDTVKTVDIKKYRPLSLNTKSTIHPVIANEGDTLPLKQICPDAEQFVFSVGFKKPPYLFINASNELVIGSGTDQTVLIKLTAINRIDSQDFEFYLVIRQAAAPTWRKVSELTMRADSRYDLFQIVPDAETIEYRSGRDRLADSSVSNGVFRVGTVGGTAEFTARKGGRSSHIEIQIDVVQRIADINPSNPFRYRVEIEGIDVTGDLAVLPSVSETLDPVLINEYRVNEASITLRNSDKKYNNDTAGNFWKANSLNPCGFQNGVKIYTEHFDDNTGNWVENLLFSGLILETFEPFREKTFKLNCVDISSRLRNALVQNFGTLEKWDSLRRQSDEENFEGVYVPDRSLTPMQPETVTAWADRTELTLSRLQLQSEGPVSRNSAYASVADLRTGGGYLDSNPIARFKTQHRSEDVRFLISQLALNKGVYNIELDIPGVTVANPFLLNRGSVPFSVEKTRT